MTRKRGRPRQFDADLAVATARDLFHTHGYDAVGVAEITSTLGIKPPSFYAAYGSKCGLFQRALQDWSENGGIPFQRILGTDRPLAQTLQELLEVAAKCYAADPEKTGCMVLQGTLSIDPQARSIALAMNRQAESLLHECIAAHHPAQAQVLTDLVSATLSGLSAKARNGIPAERLLHSAQLAGKMLATLLESA